MQIHPVIVIIFSMLFLVAGCNEDLKGRIADLEADKAALQAELMQLRSANATLNQQLQEMQLARINLSAAKKDLPPGLDGEALPVTVKFRRALMGHGLVIVLNTSMKAPLTLMLEWENKATGVRRETVINLDGRTDAERGHAEGFPLEPGDTITLSNKSFKPEKITVPTL